MALALHHEICLLRATVFPTSHHDLLLTQMRAITPCSAVEKRGHAFYAPVFQSAAAGVRNDTL
jgi:hypothetical protein